MELARAVRRARPLRGGATTRAALGVVASDPSSRRTSAPPQRRRTPRVQSRQVSARSWYTLSDPPRHGRDVEWRDRGWGPGARGRRVARCRWVDMGARPVLPGSGPELIPQTILAPSSDFEPCREPRGMLSAASWNHRRQRASGGPCRTYPRHVRPGPRRPCHPGRRLQRLRRRRLRRDRPDGGQWQSGGLADGHRARLRGDRPPDRGDGRRAPLRRGWRVDAGRRAASPGPHLHAVR